MKHPVSFFLPCGDYRAKVIIKINDKSTTVNRADVLQCPVIYRIVVLEFRLFENSAIYCGLRRSHLQDGQNNSATIHGIPQMFETLDAAEKKSDPSRFIFRHHTFDI